jgi:hypothetical protein
LFFGCNNGQTNKQTGSGDSAAIVNSKIGDYKSFDRQLWYILNTAMYPIGSKDHFQIIDSFCNNDSLEMFKFSPEVPDVSLFERIRGYGIPNSVMNMNTFKYEKYFSFICSGEKNQTQKKFKKIAIRYEKDSLDKINNFNRLRRKIICDSIRNYYLDNGLDIKVKLYGKNDENIKFTYILFNDVWTHKFSKARNVEFLMDIGFKKITLTDGYDYSVYWEQ